jgi:colanic acid/amylovoran biosynthesis protein
MDNIVVYGHYGSKNHGNEAILRGFYELFSYDKFTLYTYLPETDLEFHLDEICSVKPFLRMYKRYSFVHIVIHFWIRIFKNKLLFNIYSLNPFFKNVKSNRGIYLLEAGDQYCEGKQLRSYYAYINKKITQNHGKTVMLPCTIDEKAFDDNDLIKDLNRYSLIFARESITYSALVKAGLGEKTFFAPCTAFVMKARTCDLPLIFTQKNVIGLTVGLLAQGKEEYSENVIKNSRELIKYILKNTEYSIALIPHVNVTDALNDVTPMGELYNEFKESGRIVEIRENRADEQKFIISKCRFLITVRTHASIAAYSSGVPTIVIGYSQKSKGIATDLFGTSENYVIGVDTLTSSEKLMNAFIWLEGNEAHIRKKLQDVLPSYIERINIIKSEIKRLAGELNV